MLSWNQMELIGHSCILCPQFPKIPSAQLITRKNPEHLSCKGSHCSVCYVLSHYYIASRCMLFLCDMIASDRSKDLVQIWIQTGMLNQTAKIWKGFDLDFFFCLGLRPNTNLSVISCQFWSTPKSNPQSFGVKCTSKCVYWNTDELKRSSGVFDCSSAFSFYP